MAIIRQLKKYSALINGVDNYGEGGLCHGFAYVHAAMAATGKLNWWHDALKKISEWDGSLNALDQKIILKGEDSDQDCNPQQREQPKNLRYLFERIASYVVFNFQPSIMNDANDKVIRQDRLLEVFEVYDSNSKKWLSVNKEQYRTIAGNLSDEDLKQLLTIKNLENNMCILAGSDHSCSLRSSNNKFYFYNPNFSCKTPDMI
ncbi:hypothetical protein [Piscirickettsia salmonis]|nr:hypothetical protein [Piscirickettsia salmonis]QIX56659.1 hypothetical protein GW536_15915 [Piscirickettsia salmonis]QNR80319.1 hypothetical protein ICC15_15660 [Piscirickettsia salmonis]WGZ72620.1 hypothetical protein E3220_14225 [Piscirickettsia salmonis EM-90]